jgi:hypothetical protein
VTQEELRADLAARLEAVLRRAGPLAEETVEQRAWRPPGGGWSVGQVLEHLVSNTQSYLRPLEELLARAARSDAPEGGRSWKPTIIGNFLARSLQSSRKLPAPKLWQPGPVPRPNATALFLEASRRLGELMDQAREIAWEDHRFKSPASALIRLNLGDAFLALVVHAERHLGQIERIRALPGYPPG